VTFSAIRQIVQNYTERDFHESSLLQMMEVVPRLLSAAWVTVERKGGNEREQKVVVAYSLGARGDSSTGSSGGMEVQ